MPEANENEPQGVRSQTLRVESIRPGASCRGVVQGFIRAVRLIPYKIEKAKGRWEADFLIREFVTKTLMPDQETERFRRSVLMALGRGYAPGDRIRHVAKKVVPLLLLVLVVLLIASCAETLKRL